MSLRRRPSHSLREARRGRLGALVLTSGLLVLGCGSDPAPEGESYLLTDLEGGTAAPSAVLGSATGTATPAPADEAPTGTELISRIGEAVAAFDSVVVTRGNGTPPPDLRAGFTYGATNDFAATVFLGPGTDEMLVERVDGTLYVGDADTPPQPVDADEVAPDAGGSLPALFVWSPLLDLRAVLTSAGPVTVDASAADGTAYRFDIALGALPRPSTIAPGRQRGSATATLTVDDDSLPVQLEISYGESVAVVGYSDWGAPVELSVS